MSHFRMIGTIVLAAVVLLAGCASVRYRATTGVLLGDEVERLEERYNQKPGELYGYQAGGTVGVEFSKDGIHGVEVCGLSEFYWRKPYTVDDPTSQARMPGMVPFSLCADFATGAAAAE